MTVVGIIGSGNIGGTVAELAVRAGHEVVVSNSRGPETLKELVNELGPLARAATRSEAAAAGDLVLVSMPIKAYPSLSELALSGKTVMDTGNYYPDRDGEIPELAAKTLTDSEYLARHLRGTEVVKVFNNIFYKHLLNLARPQGAGDRSALPICGDSARAKATVVEFLNSIGYDVVDVGSLSDGWRQQPGTPAYGPPYGAFDNEFGTSAAASTIEIALASASQ
jgi:hypothetical protein